MCLDDDDVVLIAVDDDADFFVVDATTTLFVFDAPTLTGTAVVRLRLTIAEAATVAIGRFFGGIIDEDKVYHSSSRGTQYTRHRPLNKQLDLSMRGETLLCLHVEGFGHAW